ncbi:MAG: polyhydroxyalkanoate synthesis regulator DNA-binding domain-containing protein [candidate division WOR-3 bacterium]
MRKKIRLIHRYSNRKMYDTAGKAFITLGQVLRMIAQGIRVKVIDKVSGIDVTNLIRIRAIANEAERIARRMSSAASRDAIKLQELAVELGNLMREMARLSRIVKKEAQNGS